MSLNAPPATIQNITAYIGTDNSYVFTVFQSDGVTPVNITGFAIQFVVEEYGNSAGVFITKTVGSGVTLTNPTQGQFTVSLVAADTASMYPGQYAYRTERTDSGSDTVYPLGLFTLFSK